MEGIYARVEERVGWPLDPLDPGERNGEYADLVGDGHTARAAVQRALLAEIGWISRTVSQLTALDEHVGEIASTPEWRERVERILADVGQPRPDEKRYRNVVRTLVLASIASDVDGRLTTTVYRENTERIGLFTSRGTRALVEFYGTVDLLDAQLRRFEADVATNGVGPAETVAPATAIRREATIEAIDQYAAALSSAEIETIDAILDA